MGDEVLKPTNVMILENDGLIRRALAKALSEVLPPGVRVAVADDHVMKNVETVKAFITHHTPDYRALIGIKSVGSGCDGFNGFKLLDTLFAALELEVSQSPPKPILVSFHPLVFLTGLNGGELLQDESIYLFLQLPVDLRELVDLLLYGGVIS